ncbi:hypothetical protein EDD53_1739 [Pacificibacter maritimus]|uniref:MerR family transcriptional regulator n=1 Tax=Pacificibacter maritimus TaxID=762213 RepID=A0A3N4U9C5_9RHOB|nr:hypothetical protein [Pacificibacter maritimus]RPE67333.1 hypothetical protein EDD53_1739 [Pacificibacter maritimus]
MAPPRKSNQNFALNSEKPKLLLDRRKPSQAGASLFDDTRNYVLGDEELNLLGDRDKLAQWRHKNMGPAFYRLGRKIIYRGADLNAYAEANRVEPGHVE